MGLKFECPFTFKKPGTLSSVFLLFQALFFVIGEKTERPHKSCPKGYWGVSCDSPCLNCDAHGCTRNSGVCHQCMSGWDPKSNCSQRCPVFTFGYNCSDSCLQLCGQDCEDRTTGGCPIDTDAVLDFSPKLSLNTKLKQEHLAYILPVFVIVAAGIGGTIFFSNKRARDDEERKHQEYLKIVKKNRTAQSLDILRGASLPEDLSQASPSDFSNFSSIISEADEERKQMRLGAPHTLSHAALSRSLPSQFSRQSDLKGGNAM